MNLKHTLRKAAELLVELPPEGDEAAEGDAASAFSSASTDQLWAELEKATQRPSGTPSPLPGPTKTVAQIVQEAPGPNLDQIKVAPGSLPAMDGPEGTLDFADIYRAANLPTVPYSAEQVLELLASLPAELPLATRRQMVKAAMNSMGKTIGATPENIVADASRKLAALSAYTDNMSKLATEYSATAEKKIATLQAEIEATRRATAQQQQKQARQAELCAAESHRLDEALEFFSLDVPPSKYAPAEEKKA